MTPGSVSCPEACLIGHFDYLSTPLNLSVGSSPTLHPDTGQKSSAPDPPPPGTEIPDHSPSQVSPLHLTDTDFLARNWPVWPYTLTFFYYCEVVFMRNWKEIIPGLGRW